MKRAVTLVFALFADGCGSSIDPPASEFPAEPYATMISETGELSIEVRTSPAQPLDRGVARALFTITRGSGVPIDGLQIEVTPWMPAMAHGTSLRPIVSAEGNGRYVIDNLGLFMPGQWQLKTSFAGAVEDRVTPTIEVR